jgi:uracil phosphoribosyltransferase
MKPLRDVSHLEHSYTLSELDHRYGDTVHILNDPFLSTQLASLCSQDTTQPLIHELITEIYTSLFRIAVNREFPKTPAVIHSRMSEKHPEGIFECSVIDPATRAVSVNLARAGTVPSMICYQALNYLLDPKQVRQDHISIARQTDSRHHVTGSAVSGHKIGGPVDDSILLIPDPMGATGATILETLELYQKFGEARKIIALHCIITPEYLKKVLTRFPEVRIYAVRLDRGLSPAPVLQSIPGTHWDLEKGLNQEQYIVPGGGGFGEILNNAYV